MKTNKEIIKALKEFREENKNKTYDEYINMYPEKEKETFDIYFKED